MADVIILIIVAIVLIFAVRSSMRHFSGKGDCCGGSSGLIDQTKPEKKKLDGPVLGTRVIKIAGMHCDNCVRSVTEAIDRIDGASAKVNLKKETAVVSYDKELDDEALKKAVEEAGFTVVSITEKTA